MRPFYFIYSDYTESKLALKLKLNYTIGDSDYYQAVSNKVKATKRNIALFRNYAYCNKSDYTNSEYDCNGSRFTRFTVKVKNGKCWLKEYTSYNY